MSCSAASQEGDDIIVQEGEGNATSSASAASVEAPVREFSYNKGIGVGWNHKE